jgi:hypothetical protein
MDLLNGRRAILLAGLAGFCILAAGFLVGRTVGNGDGSTSSVGSTPARITSRHSSVRIPTLGGAKQIPPLEVTRQAAEAKTEEGTTPGYTEASPTPEPEPEAEPQSPAPSHEPPPEVTVTPNG